MSLIDPTVRDEWCAFSKRFEGRVPYMYLDVKGLVTTGLGCLIDPVERALPCSWRSLSGDLATEDDVRAEWARVKAMAPGLAAGRYPVGAWLHLLPDDIAALALARLDASAAQLARTWPAFGSFPAPAQQALLSLAWAMGAGYPATWPHLSAAVLAQDWAAAARNCEMSTAGNPGLAPRNAANVALFEAACQ